MTLGDLFSVFMQPVTKTSIAYNLNGDGMITTTDLIPLPCQMS